MQLKLTPVVTGLCLLGLVSVPAFAAPASDNSHEQQLIEKLSQQTAALQKEVASLQAQVKSLKTSGKVSRASTHSKPAVNVAARKAPAEAVNEAQSYPPSSQAIYQGAGIQKSTTPVKTANQPEVVHSVNEHPIYIGGMPIVTSPYLGQPATMEPFDLIAFIPNVGFDLSVLKERAKTYKTYQMYGLSAPTDPMVQVSGGVEAQYINQRPYTGNKTSDIDLTRGEIDILGNINPWVSSFVDFAYDNSYPGTGARVSDSRVYLDKGFINIGNLTKTPFYGTIGQFYVPFGEYSSYMISDSLPKILARTKARAALLGYDQTWGAQELNVSTYAFKSDTKTNTSESKLNNLGLNIDYNVNEANWNATLGGSVISDMSDSLGMQNNGAGSGFAGFAETTTGLQPTNVLVRHVPAYDFHTIIGIGSYNLIAEYVEAFHDYSPLNMTYNGHGADPAALNVEGVYNFHVFDKPSSFAVGYGMTKDALALLLPRQRYIATFNTTIWKDTLESLEFRHDINYPGSATATGQGIAVNTSGAGHTSDTLTFQIGVYF